MVRVVLWISLKLDPKISIEVTFLGQFKTFGFQPVDEGINLRHVRTCNSTIIHVEKYDHVAFEEERFIMCTLLKVVFNQSFA